MFIKNISVPLFMHQKPIVWYDVTETIGVFI